MPIVSNVKRKCAMKKNRRAFFLVIPHFYCLFVFSFGVPEPQRSARSVRIPKQMLHHQGRGSDSMLIFANPISGRVVDKGCGGCRSDRTYVAGYICEDCNSNFCNDDAAKRKILGYCRKYFELCIIFFASSVQDRTVTRFVSYECGLWIMA